MLLNNPDTAFTNIQQKYVKISLSCDHGTYIRVIYCNFELQVFSPFVNGFRFQGF